MKNSDDFPPRAEPFSGGYNRRADEIAFGRDPREVPKSAPLDRLADLLLLPLVFWQTLIEAIERLAFSKRPGSDVSHKEDTSQG